MTLHSQVDEQALASNRLRLTKLEARQPSQFAIELSTNVSQDAEEMRAACVCRLHGRGARRTKYDDLSTDLRTADLQS